MDTDQIAGKFKDATGKAEAAIGDATGDRETQVSGREREAAGKVQDLYGQARDVLGDAVGSGTASLSKEINARPLIALLIAALVGYVVASLMHSSTSRR